jgi:hypothetical protein
MACGAMVAGPGIVGGAVASADLLGIDLDIFDIFCHNDKKCDGNNDRRGVPEVGSKVPEVRINGTLTTEEPKRGIPDATRGLPGVTGGGGDVPRSGGTDRPANLPPVPTAPGSREIVIRGSLLLRLRRLRRPPLRLRRLRFRRLRFRHPWSFRRWSFLL